MNFTQSPKIIVSLLKFLVGIVVTLQMSGSLASANPITWTFESMPGVTGSFTYDADQTGVCSSYPPNTNPNAPQGCVGLLSSWDVTVTCPATFDECGTASFSYTFTSANSYVAAVTANVASIYMSSTNLDLQFYSQDRTDAEGTLTTAGLLVYGPIDGINVNFIDFNYEQSDDPGAYITSSAVPEPMSGALLGASLIALCVGRRLRGVGRRVPINEE